MTGPLAGYGPGLAGELGRLGFTERSARGQLHLAAHLSRWLDAAGLGPAALSAPVVEAFLASRRAAGYTAFLTPRALEPLLGYLRGLGVAPAGEVAVAPGPAGELLERFRGYLLAERGVQPVVAGDYADLVRPFVVRYGAAGGAGLGQLTAGEVTSFLTGQSRRLAPGTARRLATALRSLLRFWHVEGLVSGPLDQAVPKVADRRPALPRGLEPAQVQALLASCDAGTDHGRRDRAMLILLARVGLRAGEVAGLALEDIDWQRGLLTIAGKGNRRDQLPLPADAGEAIAGWLQHGRPRSALDRCVFIRVKAPHRGLTAAGVTARVAAAARRAGLGTIYAHRLRHSAATAMLAEGGSLAEIGQVLRHRRPQTTAAYTKVGIGALRALARPWPGASS
jgi:site-specific recombinase XerD